MILNNLHRYSKTSDIKYISISYQTCNKICKLKCEFNKKYESSVNYK